MKHQGCAEFAVRVVVGVLAIGGVGAMGAAQAQPQGGDTEWATIGAVGNKGYDRYDPREEKVVIGRGVVNYEYRIATHEVTTGEWMEFLNAVNGKDERGAWIFEPYRWGAEDDLSYTGPGNRFKLDASRGPDAARLPVAGIGWRDAARYVNWLHNGKQNDTSTLTHGAYDTSTFGRDEQGKLTDQARRSDGAKYWIPSFDEWFKAVHFDPNRVNEDGSVGGWWIGPYGKDTLPERDETSTGLFDYRTDDLLPVMSYDTRTPWGLADASGGVSEWLEDYHGDFVSWSAEDWRLVEGSNSWNVIYGDSDYAYLFGAEELWFPDVGLRIAASIPAPGSACAIGIGCFVFARRRRAMK